MFLLIVVTFGIGWCSIDADEDRTEYEVRQHELEAPIMEITPFKLGLGNS